MDLLERYREEISADLVVNDFNIKEVQLKLPARRHFWVARLIDAKIEVARLTRSRRDLRTTLIDKIVERSPTRILRAEAEYIADQTEDIQNISNSLKEYEFIIEYLEKVERIMSSLNYDIKNIIEIQKLQQL